MRWTFHEGDLDSSDVQHLLEFHYREMRAISPPSACHVLPADGLDRADVIFWAMREDDALLAVGALRQLAPGLGEVKSMRTAPHALGRGVGTAMLHHIIDEARARGCTRLNLETGSTPPFHAALRLYEREGFVRCGPFGDYTETPFSRFFTRAI